MRDKNINHLWYNQESEIGYSYAPRPKAPLTQLDYA
jgi:hypothetical protein